MNTFIIIVNILVTLSSYTHTKAKSENTIAIDQAPKASVLSVSSTGSTGNYTFSVEISSPDTGCKQYANWWEVITEDGSTLIYRRILGHSHVNEQPFVRSGRAVSISENEIIIIRDHMNTSGYGTNTFKGSIANGFTAFTVPKDFATELATQKPLPSNCAF